MTRRTRPALRPRIRFDVQWVGWDGVVVGTTQIERRSLTEAIIFACNRLRYPRDDKAAADAHGFYVVASDIARDRAMTALREDALDRCITCGREHDPDAPA